jgi:hypothetical protein
MGSAVDRSFQLTHEGHAAFDRGELGVAAERFAAGAEQLRGLLRSGKVTDPRSAALLAKQCDELERLARTARRKEQEAKEKALTERALALRGMQLAPKSQAELAREEAALRERFAALQVGGTASASSASSTAAEDALEARLAKLGPSQFPDLNDDAAQLPREDLEVQMALQTVARESASEGEPAPDPRVEALLRSLGSDVVADKSDAALAQLLGQADSHDADVDAIIKQARDYARFGRGSAAAAASPSSAAAAAAAAAAASAEGAQGARKGHTSRKSTSRKASHTSDEGDASSSDSSGSDLTTESSDEDGHRKVKRASQPKPKRNSCFS